MQIEDHVVRLPLAGCALARHWAWAQQHEAAGEPAERDGELRDVDALLAEWFVDDALGRLTADPCGA